jgi:hypothetical protein
MPNTFWESFSVLVTVLFEEKGDEEKQSIFMSACKKGDVEIVHMLLEYTDFVPPATMISVASENGHVTIVERLLQKPIMCMDPSDDDNFAIRIASENGHVAVVDRLLQEPTRFVNPSDFDNYAIRFASENGHIEVVERLLQDSRVDPFAVGNYAILWACRNGHIAVVDRLLQEITKYLIPFYYIHGSIRCSSYNGHADIVYILLQYKRQDKRIYDDNDIGMDINKAKQRGYSDVVNILLQHKAHHDNKLDEHAYS